MILTGGIDLSMQYTLVLCNVVSAQVISGQNENTWMALAVSILISAVIGLINGFGVYFLKIPAMIMTLATGSAVWGIAYIYCNGAPKGKTSEILSFIANGKIGGIINGASLIWMLLSVAVILVLKFTVFGRTVYAVGVNRESANYSGINVPATLIGIYVAASVLAGISGFILLGYTVTSYPDVVKADALHPAGYNVLYPGFLDKCRERNRQLHVWTINEEKDMRMLCEAGVDAIITNYPDIAKKIRDEYRFGELQPELVQRILQN